MAANYYLAPSLISLRNELNEAHPDRDKASDGWIGDASHAARKSDHNPDWDADGVVRALDIDKDGIDIDALWRAVKDDPRVEYVIWTHHIATRANGMRWAKYTGPNPHDKHMHISLRHIVSAEKSGRWGYAEQRAASPSPAAPAPTPNGLLSLDQVARQVIAGSWGSGEERRRRLASRGYNYEQVQAEVNRQLGAKPAPARKSVEQVADEVLAGVWGNNPERSRKLQAAGYSPTEVQNAVNAKVGTSRPAAVRESVGTVADQVIRGQWGSGLERRRRIAAAGYSYDAVQAEVNRRLK